MVQMSKYIETAWNSLEHAPSEGNGWRTIQISTANGIVVHAGRRFPERTEAMLVRFHRKPLKSSLQLPSGAGFSVESVDRNDDGYWLALTRREHAMPEFFLAMVLDILGAISALSSKDDASAFNTFLGRVKAWQEFMRKGQAALSPEAEVGLFGELLVLQEILDTGKDVEDTLNEWIGPLRDGIQDFHIGTGAIEVKSTLAVTGFPAKIGSLEQLDDSSRAPLFVGAMRLRTSDTGRSLPTLVNTLRARIRTELPGSQVFDERLVAVGYLDMHAAMYTRLFEPVQSRFILVGQEFPRFIMGGAKAGMVSARYEIDLDKASGEDCLLGEVLKRLKVN